jgi:tRNA1(Val) A37 N6-methylase TrmN6
MMNLLPADDESLDDLALGLGLRVLQRRRGHRSATDDVLAAWSAQQTRPEAKSVLDLGCGHGTVTLLLSGLLPEAEFVSVEVQEVSYALLQRNIVLNGLAHRVRGVRCDLRELALEQKFDLVTGTPPFMPLGSGVLPKDEQRAAGRFELRGGIEAYLETAKEHLAPEGSVSILMDGAQDRRCREAFSRLRLHLHQVRVFDPRPGRPSRYRCYIGGLEPSPVPVSEHHLLIREEDGSYSGAMVGLRQQVGVEV